MADYDEFFNAAHLEESFKPLVIHETIHIMGERRIGMAALLNLARIIPQSLTIDINSLGKSGKNYL